MGSNTETGHVKNVSNFETLLAYCLGYGNAYRPTKYTIQIGAMQQLLMDARASITTVIEAYKMYNSIKNERILAFKGFNKYITRIVNVAEVSDLNEQLIEDIKGLARKIKGIRKNKKKKAMATSETAANGTQNNESETTTTMPDAENGKPESEKQISSAQTSRDQVNEHFAMMIALLQSSQGYHPNEEDLQFNAMLMRLEKMRYTNSAFLQYKVNWSNTLLQRDALIYGAQTGICDVAQDVKKYIKAIFGVNSPQYAQIRSIVFTRKKAKRK
ncbi:MAG: hypothetical protein ACK4TA_00625 [Saprospiraceae bacterium]